MLSQYFFASFIISALLVPVLANAATVDEIRAQIQSLISQITALQAQLSNLTSDTTTISTPSNSCPNLYRALSRGSRGSDVISLQQFFIAQGLLDSDSATGFFGPLTEVAVQRWQAQNSIISYGDAASTGYGVIGPRTRAAIAAKCGTTPVLPSGSLCPAVTDGSCPQGYIGSYISENGCTGLKCTPSSSSKPTVSVSVSAQSFKQGDTVSINWQVSNESHLLKHVIVSLDLYTAGGEYVQNIYGTSGTLAGTKQWGGRTVCPFEPWYCSFVTSGSYKIRATLTHDETGSTPIATAETASFNITTVAAVTPPVVGRTDTYIDARICYSQYGINYQSYGLTTDYVVSCSITPIAYSGGSAFFVELSVGPGQDCPSGCIYNHKAYIVAKGSVYSVPNIHEVGRREVGMTIRQVLGIDLNDIIRTIFFSNASKTDSNPQPKYLPTLSFDGVNPLLRYIFGSDEIVQGTYDVHADGSVTSQSSGQSTVLSRDQATQIAINRLAATDFSGYSLAGNPPSSAAQYDSNNKSWLFDAAAFPLRDGNEKKPRCMITVYSESNVLMGCVAGTQSVTNWSTVPMRPIEQVRFQDY